MRAQIIKSASVFFGLRNMASIHRTYIIILIRARMSDLLWGHTE